MIFIRSGIIKLWLKFNNPFIIYDLLKYTWLLFFIGSVNVRLLVGRLLGLVDYTSILLSENLFSSNLFFHFSFPFIYVYVSNTIKTFVRIIYTPNPFMLHINRLDLYFDLFYRHMYIYWLIIFLFPYLSVRFSWHFSM